jgi:hypothetical protein
MVVLLLGEGVDIGLLAWQAASVVLVVRLWVVQEYYSFRRAGCSSQCVLMGCLFYPTMAECSELRAAQGQSACWLMAPETAQDG